MNAQDVPVVNPVAVLREEFDDWAVLFNPDTAEAVGTNPIGVFIWKKMDGKRTLRQIMASVQEHFRDVPASAGEEVLAFVNRLEVKGFIAADIR